MSSARSLDWLPTAATSIVDAAALYIEHGHRVVILHGIRDDGLCTCGKPLGACKPGKHPTSNAWQKKIYATPESFRDDLASKRTPGQPNLGLVLGEQLNGDYVVAIDGDDLERLAALERVLGALPETMTSRSGGGGNHRLYSVGAGQDPQRLRNRVGVRLPGEGSSPGVDVRVAGGQIVACPSLHVSGERYSWTQRVPIAALPDLWFEAIAEPVDVPAPSRARAVRRNVVSFNDRYVERVIENNCRDIASRGKGERNQVLFTKSCTVLEHCAGAGVDFARAVPRLQEAGVACGLPRTESVDTVLKAERKVRSTGHTREAPPPASVPPPPASAGDGAGANWIATLSRDRSGNIKNTFGNVCIVLRHDDRFAGRLSYDCMTITPFIDGRPVSDADVANLREEIERRWGFPPANEALIQAVMLIANERPFHPLQDYLGGLVWDGERRIECVARDILGAPEVGPLTQRMLRCWFISAVARAMTPGCKVDTTLVLVGQQSFQKSTFFAVLGGPWFSDTYVDIRNKDGILQIHTAWIHEWAEIERVTVKTSSSDVKAFLTSAKDSVRPPFGRAVVTHPRSSVIVGTTNKRFLDDETGSRRFWPVYVYKLIDAKLLLAWRDQLWAEAVAAFRAGDKWWLTAKEEAEREDAADEHMVENPWLEKIAEYLRHPRRHETGVTIAEVMTGAMALDLGRVTHGDTVRTGKAVMRLGWWSQQETRNGVRLRVHYPKDFFTKREAARSRTACSVQSCADESPEKQGPGGSDQSAQVKSYTHKEEEGVSDVGAGVGACARASVHARVGRVKADHPHTPLTPLDRPESRTGVFRATPDTVQATTDTVHSGEGGLSDWLAEQGIASHDEEE